MAKKVKNVEEVVEEVVAVEAEAPKKKKKKSKAVEEETVEAVVAEVAVEVTDKKKKKKKAAVEETAEEAVAEEAAPVEGEKKKKKKKKTVEEVAEEAEAEEEEKPAKKAKKADSDDDEKEDVEMSPASTAATDAGKGAEAAAEEDDPNARSVFLGNLSFKASAEAIEKDMGECGEIENCHVPLNEEGRMKGIAFITFKTIEGMQKALEWNGQDYYGRDLKVEKREGGKGKGKKGKDGKKGGKKQERGEKPENCTSVMIKNLSFETTEDGLWEHFSEPAPKFIKLPTDRETGKVRGFAFLDFETTEQVDACIAAHDAKEYLGRNLFIDFNAPREKGEKGDKGFGKKGDKGDKGGKKGKGKGKGKGKKGKDSDPIKAANTGAIQEFKGEVTTFADSDSD